MRAGRDPEALDRAATARDRPQHRNQHHGSDKGDDDAADQAGTATGHEVAEDEAADKRPDDAHDDVADDPIAAALHELARQETRDQADDDPGDDATRLQRHRAPPLTTAEASRYRSLWQLACQSERHRPSTYRTASRRHYSLRRFTRHWVKAPWSSLPSRNAAVQPAMSSTGCNSSCKAL